MATLRVEDGFHVYRSDYEIELETGTHEVGRKRALAELGSPEDYYGPRIELAMEEADENELALTLSRMLAEMYWHRDSRPYYRVYPDYAHVFSQTKLDIPVKHLRAPYPAFVVRFKNEEEPVVGGMRLLSVLVMVADVAQLVQSLPCKCDDESHHRRSLMHFIANMVDAEGKPSTLFTYLPAHAPGDDPDRDITLAEMLDTVDEGEHLGGITPPASADVSRDILRTIASIAASVCFLATGGDRLVDPDLLNKDFRPYLEAVNRRDAVAVEQFAQKAQRQRNGQVGFTVGREDGLLGRRAENRTDEEIGEGRELAYQHQRKGHFHKFWTGPDREQLTVRWVRQTTVRPDLPLPPDVRRGSRTLDSKQTEKQILNGGN